MGPRWRRQTRFRSWFLAFAALTATPVASSCGTSPRKASEAPVIDVVSGRVGSLRVDESVRRQVVAFAGRPDAERRGRNTVASPFGSERYDALGYGCAGNAGPPALPLVQPGPSPKCRTVFFIEARSGRLGLFYTIDPHYRERHGVRVGMPQGTAERLLGRRVQIGCLVDIYLSSSRASLIISFNGRKFNLRAGEVIGAHVDALVLHGDRHDPGVFECE